MAETLDADEAWQSDALKLLLPLVLDINLAWSDCCLSTQHCLIESTSGSGTSSVVVCQTQSINHQSFM